ncbi:MAG: adenosylmethionine decarboxylase [Bdellovibrio sp. CG12_big_fil_rev_8_21_14_0_65_39_13]|nr:MAG: adenosylmethionine decarboxylase [Bdellovibrio sp. CG22_combo_CG10-13_8_21_14_all_39_27]PIQ62745.1 MAG: adenosylmethionine decarboxylase [Bdellovibrio sp. CG12_big_fil_rev_8_21_14_0_65_39_13]PIR36067.1 MAG: adenosylmethionine decarboxylase [Bdellovibrio sp. CG11_big_fil_rev_8_21_14_0_20_39_38]PJB52307.1 MAG: adenosylmethionine decarboxylase [Bdellovibrio sp. CG_4_9_14_3_um_filter_39_7]
MFFEGSEKKIEVVVKPQFKGLRERSKDFWRELVDNCNATILSELSNQHCDSYLLSESSLFVWDDRILMITCGSTKLIESVEMMIDEFGEAGIASLVYQRKNEYRSQLQSSSFLDDVERLERRLDGIGRRFGKVHSHHNLIYSLKKPYQPPAEDTTTELLMYDFDPSVTEFLTQKAQSKEEIRAFINLESVIEGLEIDDFLFEPFGYSMNGLRGDDYVTIHITPQDTSPYISFETDLGMEENKSLILNHLLKVFKPNSFDIITFNTTNEFDLFDRYIKASACNEQLECGYTVEFDYYYKSSFEIEKPFIFLT